MNETRPVVCCAGTTDPWNGAGLGLDLRVLDAFGVRGVTVVAGISAQNARGIASLRAIDADTIDAQFAALDDAPIAAYRIGALLDLASARAVARELARERAPAVYDPVLGASGGGRFADGETIAGIRADLLPRVALVTPNLGEARILANDETLDARAAARALRALGARAVLVTGDVRGTDLVDRLYADGVERDFAAPRLPGELRGTGCMLAAGIAASLASRFDLVEAIERARAFVRERIVDGETVGGMRLMHVRGRAARES